MPVVVRPLDDVQGATSMNERQLQAVQHPAEAGIHLEIARYFRGHGPIAQVQGINPAKRRIQLQVRGEIHR